MNTNQKAEILMTTAVEFLAAKHGVSVATIIEAMKAKNEKIMRQFVDLVAEGIIATA